MTGCKARAWARTNWRLHTHSIKGRLVALFVLLALATTLVFLWGTQKLLQSGWQSYVRPLVADYAQRLAADLGSPPQPARALALAQRLPVAVHIEGPQVQLDTHPGRFDRRFDRRLGPGHTGSDGGDAGDTSSDGDLRPGSWTVQQPDGHRISFALVAPPDSDRPRLLGWATLAALLTLTALAYAAVRRQLRPLQDISRGVQAFGAGQFDTPIPVQRPDELGELAQRINHMAHSLNGMLDAKRALLLAMSHELRSPLTRARVNAELLDDSPERQALLRDLGEMRDLISSLLEGERLADGHRALHTETVDLAALVAEAVAADALAHPQLPAAVVQVDGPGGPWVVQADATRLRLLLRNLLQNARRHGQVPLRESVPEPVLDPVPSPANANSAAPLVFLRRQADGRRALGVRDHGPGLQAEHLSMLAQAFYRPDTARTRSTGGVGLGLYLCRLVSQAHGGELVISNAQPGLQVAMVW